jgi:hypothetical protein
MRSDTRVTLQSGQSVRVIEMGLAIGPAEREAVFRFWYSVYVEEMDRYRDVADHASRMLRGPEDERSLIFCAKDGDEVVAACRWSWGADGFTDRQIAQYQLEPFLRSLPHEVMIIGERTMVAASHRGGSVYVDLGNATATLAEERGVRPLLSFGASEPHLVSYYAQFGQRPYAVRQSFSEESGYIIPTVNFLRGADAFGDDPPRCIRDAIAGSPSVRNAAVDGAKRYVAAVRDALGPDQVGALAGMTADDIERVATRGTLLTCAKGDQILRRGGTARNPFIVISGRLEARLESGAVARLGPGDLFGESGWLADERRQADVLVVDEWTRILALSEGALRRLDETDPRLAGQLHANVATMLWARLRDAGGLIT